MVELLSKGTKLPVLVASNGLVVEANTIYVCPPDENIFLDGNTILLAKPKINWHGPKPSVDLFFESLAESKEDKSIGIILSGTGSDGSRGLRAIKGAGGFTIVQEPSSAKYDGMPNSAIHTGIIDLILQADDMGKELEEMLNYAGKIVLKKATPSSTNIYKNILSKLREIKGVDFNQYKPSTIERRIERRMMALKIIKISDYYAYIVQNIDEVGLLFKDILIGVTTFFRDGDSFYILKEHMEEYLKHKKDKIIRIWAPGCSTGEEAYSLAMILSEILGADIGSYKIQIFATDVNEDSLHFARKGLYPESALLSLDKTIQNRYFSVKNEHYEVNKSIRSMVIFSRHNILKDPAFLRLDLVVCRNLLIYFSQELQKKLFPEFHYALNDGGLLFLGKSESVGHFQSYFKTIDKKWKIYKTSFIGAKEPPTTVSTYQANDLLNSTRIISETKKPTINDIVVEYVNDFIIPMCVVINENMDIVYVKGHNPYLIRPDGDQTQNIFKNINTTLSIELRASIHECSKQQAMFKSNFQKVVLLNEVERFVRMAVVPISNKNIDGLYLVCFQEEDSANFQYYTGQDIDTENPNSIKLEEELSKAKEYLQTVIEELETSNEEMQSLNEELQSSNEELQSSNEELETTNEELQSTNEELQTAYTELRAIYEEREQTAKEIRNINIEYKHINKKLEAALECSELGICDYHIPVKKDDIWDERWASILGYTLGELPSDKSHMSDWIESRVHKDDLKLYHEKYDEYISGKVDTYKIRFKMQHKKDGFRHLESFAMAYERNRDGKVLHSISTLKDITKEMQDQEKLSQSQERLSLATQSANIGLWEMKSFRSSVYWDKKSYEMFGIKMGTEITFEVWKKCVHPDDLHLIQNELEASISQKRQYSSVLRILRPNGELLYYQATGRPIFNADGSFEKMVGTNMDITDFILNKKHLE